MNGRRNETFERENYHECRKGKKNEEKKKMRLREEIEQERSTEEGLKEEEKSVNRERNNGDDFMDWADKCRSLIQ